MVSTDTTDNWRSNYPFADRQAILYELHKSLGPPDAPGLEITAMKMEEKAFYLATSKEDYMKEISSQLQHLSSIKLLQEKNLQESASTLLGNQEESSSKIESSKNYRGVRRLLCGKWSAHIRCPQKGVRVTLGIYDTEKEAAIAYNNELQKIYGEKAKVNVLDAPPGCEHSSPDQEINYFNSGSDEEQWYSSLWDPDVQHL